MKIPTRVVLVLVVLAALGSSVSAQAVGQIPVWDGINLIGDSVITQNSDGSLSINVALTGAAVLANNSATSGNTNGLFGNVGSPDGNGVLGQNYATWGFAVGVTGITYSPAGAGLNGFSASTSGGIGVIGSSPASGTGVIGQNQVCGPSSCTKVAGTAGAFVTGAGGTILVGQVGDQNQNGFRVDDTGKGFFDGGTQTGGADFAESVAIAAGANRYGPGDLLALDTTADRQLTLSTEPYSTPRHCAQDGCHHFCGGSPLVDSRNRSLQGKRRERSHTTWRPPRDLLNTGLRDEGNRPWQDARRCRRQGDGTTRKGHRTHTGARDTPIGKLQYLLGPGYRTRQNFWRRGPDLNRRMMVLQTIPLDHLGTAPHAHKEGLKFPP